jgi:hypothetical protein
MAGFFVVVQHMVVLGQVAASNVSANQTDAQMQPIIIELYAFGAGLVITWRNLLHEIDM